jgi:hypothetical protein
LGDLQFQDSMGKNVFEIPSQQKKSWVRWCTSVIQQWWETNKQTQNRRLAWVKSETLSPK